MLILVRSHRPHKKRCAENQNQTSYQVHIKKKKANVVEEKFCWQFPNAIIAATIGPSVFCTMLFSLKKSKVFVFCQLFQFLAYTLKIGKVGTSDVY